MTLLQSVSHYFSLLLSTDFQPVSFRHFNVTTVFIGD